MALNPSAAYPAQIDTTDPTGYPYGRAKNVAAIGDGTGTPLEQKWVSDLFGFEQALLVAAAITPTNSPDKVGASQYLDAIKKIADARARLAAYRSQAMNWPERTSFADTGDSTAPNGSIGIAWAPDLGAGGGGRYVLVAPSNTAGMQVWSSEDGGQWSYGGLNNAAFQSVAYGVINGASGFVMTRSAPAGHYTSLDGISWGLVSATLPANGTPCYSASLGLWVIAGDAGVLYTSPTATGGSWTARTTPAGWIAGCGGVRRVVFAAGLFVVLPLGSYDKCLTSPDGITWTERSLHAFGFWTGLAYSAFDGLWMASSNGSAVATSPDGITWTVINSAIASNDLAVNGPLWVMATNNGAYGGIAWSMDKGVTWTFGTAVGNHRVATAGWNRIIAADNRFAVADATGAAVEVALSARAQ